MIWFASGVVVLVLLVFVQNQWQQHKTRKRRQQLAAEWGKPRTDPYFNFQLIEKYFRQRTAGANTFFQVIPDRVCEDLNLHAAFERLDRTVSRIGQQFLYYRLRAVQNDPKKLHAFDAYTEQFAANPELRSQVQLLLQDLSGHQAYHFEALIHETDVPKPRWFPAVYLLSFSMVALAIGSFFNPGLLLVMLVPFILNLVIYLWNKNNITYHSGALSVFPKVYQAGQKLAKLPTAAAYFGNTSFLPPLKPLQKGMGVFALNNRVEGDFTTLLLFFTELIKIAFNVEIILFFSLIGRIKAQKEALHALFRFIGETDCALSVASFRSGLPTYCKPDFGTANLLAVSGLQHPLIAGCVPNDLQLVRKSLLLTGSNMSGKTTFIRTVGLNLLLGQTLFTCMAQQFRAPFSRVFSAINLSDNLLAEKSYYFEEVTTIKAFLDEAEDPAPAIFILDELFKGTNTAERIAGGKAILSYLAQKEHLVLVSTHDLELTELLEDQFSLYHFSETVDNGQLVFDHKLKPGPLKTRNAIKILALTGYPAEIVADATQTVAFLAEKVIPKAV